MSHDQIDLRPSLRDRIVHSVLEALEDDDPHVSVGICPRQILVSW